MAFGKTNNVVPLFLREERILYVPGPGTPFPYKISTGAFYEIR